MYFSPSLCYLSLLCPCVPSAFFLILSLCCFLRERYEVWQPCNNWCVIIWCTSVLVFRFGEGKME